MNSCIFEKKVVYSYYNLKMINYENKFKSIYWFYNLKSFKMENTTNNIEIKKRIDEIISERKDGMHAVANSKDAIIILEYIQMLVDYCYYAGYIDGIKK